jgi:hypothetical protein
MATIKTAEHACLAARGLNVWWGTRLNIEASTVGVLWLLNYLDQGRRSKALDMQLLKGLASWEPKKLTAMHIAAKGLAVHSQSLDWVMPITYLAHTPIGTLQTWAMEPPREGAGEASENSVPVELLIGLGQYTWGTLNPHENTVVKLRMSATESEKWRAGETLKIKAPKL